MTIVIPPLRRRRDEIPLLARQAVIRCCRRNGMEEKELSPLLLEMLAEYDWPGNVRELFHTLERACLAAEHASLLLPAHLATGLRVAVARSRAGQGRPAAGRSVPRWPKPGPVACPTCLPCRKRGGPFLRCAAGGMRRSGTMWPGYGRCAATMPGPPHAWPASPAGTGTNC